MHSKKCYNKYIIKLIWAKHRPVILIASAGVLLLTLFWIKNGTPWGNKEIYKGAEGLSYENALVADILARDTDGDEVLDWEESLLGLDPTKPETTAGTPDSTAANKLRGENGTELESGENKDTSINNLTETDKFAQELFSAVTALEQSGSLDQKTAEKMVASLVENIENPPQRKIYTIADLKIGNDNTITAIQTYNNSLTTLLNNNKTNYTVMGTVQKLAISEDGVDTRALSDLNLITEKFKKIIDGMVKMSVPNLLAPTHLDVINSLERVMENINDMKLYGTDTLVTLSAIMQYEESVKLFMETSVKLNSALTQRLSR